MATFTPIGTITSGTSDPKAMVHACRHGLNTQNEATITINEEYAEGLVGIEEFSHAFIIYHLDQVRKEELITNPGLPEMTSLKKVGVFASRSQYRPNPLALRLVRILKREGNTLVVQGMDGIDGSPVLDIKPYVQGFDRPATWKQASWYDWLETPK